MAQLISRSCGQFRAIQNLRSINITSLRCLNLNSNKMFTEVITKNAVKPQQQNVRNISLTAPKLMSAGGNHSTLWTVERGFSLGLLGIIPAALMFPSQALDAMLAVSVVMHQHWGLEACVTDYIRPILFGNMIPKLAHGLLLVLSMATLGGLFYFIYNDIGIAKAVRKLWSIKAE